ncbi:MAG: efflux RND transporter periplasmic adaptor subunit [Candidatus Binataceae bacterium]|jgi:HlyD family secretion protein
MDQADTVHNGGGSSPSQGRGSEPRASNSHRGVIINSKKSRSRRKLLFVAVSIAAIAIVSTVMIQRHYQNTGAQDWVAAKISRGSIVRVVTATGTVDPVITVQVGSYVSGPITAIYADYNSPVKAGQLIAKIDPRPFQVKVDEAKAALANATAQLHKDIADQKYKRVAYQRYATLLKERAVSQDAFDSAQSASEQVTAQIELDRATIQQQQASLRDAELNLKYTDIVSPVSGTTIAREVDVGQTVAASFQTPTLFLIAKDLTKMQVDSNVSEADIGEVRAGQKAKFTVDAYDRAFEGVVTQVRRNPTTVQNVVTYDVVITADNPQMMLAPGMTANVKIITQERRNVLRAPLQAVRYESAGVSQDSEGSAPEDLQAFLWIPDGAQRKRLPVMTGVRGAKFVEIISDRIRLGDMIFVEPAALPETGSANQLPPPPPGMP